MPTSADSSLLADSPDDLLWIFRQLADYFGPRHWWPAETPFEVVIGAILTQNTAWRNVEYAIDNLRRAGALSAEGLLRLPPAELEGLIRPAGFFRQKAERLLLFAGHLARHHGNDLAGWLSGPLQEVRDGLLDLKGIGPETADSILLYAANRPTFVIDAYTRRLGSRLGVLDAEASYPQLRQFFMDALPADPALFNEYHALIVEQCKTFCRKTPRCAPCPLRDGCPAAAA